MTKKKIVKSVKIVGLILFCCLLICTVYNLISLFTSGNLQISTTLNSSYYSGSNLVGDISVRKEDSKKQIPSKLKIELYDVNNKKIKGFKETYKLDKGENAVLDAKIPENLETGKYSLKITAKYKLNKEVSKVPINLIKDKNSNIIISLDKGIYKPGDEVNFRTLLLSKKDNKPVKNEVSIYIYDGNDNKVYSNTAETSEYGIISGNFKLADEVNSGTYRITVSNDSQEVSKEFTVNPYITPKFETSISTDKDAYIIGEQAQINLSAKYFFAQPVAGAKVTGTINETEVTGMTDQNGNFSTTYNSDKAENVEVKLNVTDDSNYMVEAEKSIRFSTDILEIELLPEYENIIKGVDNNIYVYAKDLKGNPIKTYSTIVLGKISKQVITDENGTGVLTLTSSETDELKIGSLDISVNSEDMSGNKINKKINKTVTNYNVLIKTDKVKYEKDDDIELTLISKLEKSTNLAYVYKNNELLKTLTFDNNTIKFNLDGITGLIDIYVPKTNSVYDAQYSNSGYLKRTIFVKPNEKLNIGIDVEKEQYKPGENLKVKFNTTDENNNNIDSALLVSILDEAVLNLAENDLSIDNIKLALQDIKLNDEMTLADLYASILDESSEATLNTVLQRQAKEDPSIIYNKSYGDTVKQEYLEKTIIFAVLIFIVILVYCIVKFKNKFIIFENIVNVLALLILIIFLLSTLLDYDEVGIVFISFVLTIVVYTLILYKQRDFIFNIVNELVLIPGVFSIIIIAICLLVSKILFKVPFSYINETTIEKVLVMCYLIAILLFSTLTALSRKKELGKILKTIKDYATTLTKSFLFWIIIALIIEITDLSAILVFCLVLIVYILYKKYILKETKTEVVDKKIVLNINFGDLINIIVGIIIVLVIVFVIIVDGMTEFGHGADIDEAVTGMARNDISDVYDSDYFQGGTARDEINVNLYNNVKDYSNASQSSSFSDVMSSITDLATTNEKENSNNDNIEKDIEIEENVRNVFLESLAFVPEIITENGNAEFSNKISDNITTWNIQVVGNTKEGQIGYSSKSFKVFKEFFVDFSLPTNSVVTDKTSIPVTLYNYTGNPLAIEVNVKENDWCNIGNYQKTITVQPGATSMFYLPIEITKAGNNILRIETKAGEISDIVEKTMEVKVNGLEKQTIASSGIIENDYKQDLIFNEDAIENTKKIKVKLYPSTMSQIVNNMDSILTMPTGCFEQTSSSLYPDILVLKYLRDNKLSNPELEKKALDYISKGYQKLLTYEVEGTKGGYSLYGNSPAEPVITAFGLMELNELSEVYDVDKNVLKNMQDYLFSVQRVNGSFSYNSTYIGGASNTNEIAMNAYIIWALSEVCPDSPKLEASIDYLDKKLEDVTDSYTLALIANVYANVGEKDKAKEVIDEINEKITINDDGAWINSTIRDYYGTRGRYQNIQATALTSMALTKLNMNNKNNDNLISYLLKSKSTSGTWGTTQSTILALKAINDYNQKTEIKDQTIKVSVNGEEKSFDIEKDSLDIYEFEFDNVPNENHISIDIKKGKFDYEIIKEYYQDYSKVKNEGDIVLTQTITQTAKVNDIINQTINITNNGEVIENGLLQINIPQGCSVEESSLLQLKYQGLIEKYEYNYGKINIYIRDFEEDNISLNIQYRALYPETITGSAIRFYDYYNPETEAICNPVAITINQ